MAGELSNVFASMGFGGFNSGSILAASVWTIVTIGGLIAAFFILKPFTYKWFWPIQLMILEYTAGGFRWRTDYARSAVRNKVETCEIAYLKRKIEPLPKDIMYRKGKNKYLATMFMDINKGLHPLVLQVDGEGSDMEVFFTPRRRDVETMAYEEMVKRFNQHKVMNNMEKYWVPTGVVFLIVTGLIVMYFIKST